MGKAGASIPGRGGIAGMNGNPSGSSHPLDKLNSRKLSAGLSAEEL